MTVDRTVWPGLRWLSQDSLWKRLLTVSFCSHLHSTNNPLPLRDLRGKSRPPCILLFLRIKWSEEKNLPPLDLRRKFAPPLESPFGQNGMENTGVQTVGTRDICISTGELLITALKKVAVIYMRFWDFENFRGRLIFLKNLMKIVGGRLFTHFRLPENWRFGVQIFRLRRKNAFTPLKTVILVSKIFRLRRKMSNNLSEFLRGAVIWWGGAVISGDFEILKFLGCG